MVKKHLVNIIVLTASIFLFVWAIWQHEILMWGWIQQHWNESHAFFSGILTTKGVAYDITLLLVAFGLIGSNLALWFWNDEQETTQK